MPGKSNWKNIKKLGLGVMAFEGSEHLKNILTELRELLDFVVLSYQEVSYHNDPIDESDKATLLDLKEQGLADECICMNLDITKDARQQETDKRNQLLEYMEQQGCTHAIIIDSDEFYTYNSFLDALQKIDENDYECTYCQYVNYYHDYLHYLVYPFPQGMYVPFVSKVKYRHSFDTTDFPYPSDPTRRYVIPKDKNGKPIAQYHIFDWNEIKMHHLSWLRINIRKKMKSWSSKKCFENQELLIDQAVYDFESFDDNKKKVRLVFNTPGNAVKIAEFHKQYIFPAYDFHDCYKHVEKNYNILWITIQTENAELKQYCADKNYSYYNINVGNENIINKDNKQIYIKVPEKYNDNYNYMIISAIQLLNESYDYIVYVNCDDYNHNLDDIVNNLKTCTDESLIYSPFPPEMLSSVHRYDGGLINMKLFAISNRQFNIFANEAKQQNYFFNNENSLFMNNLAGQVYTVFSDRAKKIGAHESTYITYFQL